MGAGGDFWDDTTIIFENVNLRNYDVALDVEAIGDDGDGGFVAGSFNTKDIHGEIITYY